MKCTSCGAELKSEFEICPICGNEREVSVLPEEDDTLPSLPWHHPDNGNVSSLSADRLAVDGRPMILIDESHKERTWSEEFKPFKQYLRGRGRLVVATERPLTFPMLEGVKLVVVGGPEHPLLIDRNADRWHDDEIFHLQQYVENGGSLLVLVDVLSDVQRMSAVTRPFGISFSRDNVGDVTIQKSDMARHPILDDVRAFRLGDFHGGGGFYLDVVEPAFALARIDGRPILAACYYGQGMVVAISNLMIFSELYLSLADNEVLLEKLMDEVMRDKLLGSPHSTHRSEARPSETTLADKPVVDFGEEDPDLEIPAEIRDDVGDESDEAEQILDFGAESEEELGSGEGALSFDACESMWRPTLDALVELWETWDDVFKAFMADCEVVEDASFPDDRELLMEVWGRDIEQWQPKFIDLMEQELSLWAEMNSVDAIDQVSQCLLHDLQVNRTTAIVQREQYLEILKLQLEAMEAGDKFAIDELFQDATESSYASALLRNDYVDLLQNLQSRGLPIPQDHIPEREEMRKEDWERGWSIIEWMLPVDVPGNGKVHVLSLEGKESEDESRLQTQDVDDDIEGGSDRDSLDLRAA